jgi:hypothetical protein
MLKQKPFDVEIFVKLASAGQCNGYDELDESWRWQPAADAF